MSADQPDAAAVALQLLDLAAKADASNDPLSRMNAIPLMQIAGLFTIAAALQDLAAAVRSTKET
jgi:hypothetical protein